MATQEVDLNRLASAAHAARLALRRVREEKRAAVRQFVGAHWSEEAAREKVPLNLISLYISIVGRKLIAKNPKVMLSTMHRENKPAVHACQEWMNRQIKQIDLYNTLQRCVHDALYSIGICKIALAGPCEAAMGAWALQGGDPFAQRVDLDDFVVDMDARDMDEVSFIGHRFRAPLSVVQESSKYYTKARKNLTASTNPRINSDGDERIHTLGRGWTGSDDEIEDMVDLWEIYVPRHRCVYTFADDALVGMATSKTDAPDVLREQEWLGPDTGPYRMLGFSVVPGNLLPKGPVMDLVDLHVPINELLRKLIRQAQRQKTNPVFRRGAESDTAGLRDLNDGEFGFASDPEAIKEVRSGGPDQLNFQFFMQLKELFSWMAGNLDIMGGLSPQAKTAAQDNMLNQNSTAAIADMQDRTVKFTADVLESLGWFWWHHPAKVMTTEYKPKGLPEYAMTRKVYPATHPDPAALRRTAEWAALDLAVDPYSMQHQTPQQRMNDLIGIVQKVYLPIAQLAQQQGVALDLNKLFELLGQYGDMPDLEEVLSYQEPVAEAEGGGAGAGGGSGQPSETTRTYVRQNMPGRTMQGDAMNRMNAVAGIDTGGAPKPPSLSGA